MPQLVKGGKYAFGWTRAGEAGRIRIPPEVMTEYSLKNSHKMIVLAGSRTSGGFGLASTESIKSSALKAVLAVHPELAEFRIPVGKVIMHGNRPFCWVELQDGSVTLSPQTLARYGVRVGDKLLVIRGSGLAPGFAVRGPIVAEALNHPELKLFE